MRRAVPAFDLKEQYDALAPEITVATRNVFESAQFILGPAVAEVERALAAYCQASYGVGVASGTDALRLVLETLHLEPRDEVITTPFTFVATANTISHSGGTPVFADIDERTFNLDIESVESKISPRTRAIVGVHLFGQPFDCEALAKIAQAYSIPIIEDCAQAIGAECGRKRVGSLGYAGCFSFYPTKNLGAYGDGGLITTSDPELANSLDMLRKQGSKEKYRAELLGFNSRLDELQAAILRVKLRYLDTWNHQRRELAKLYGDHLSNTPLALPTPVHGTTHVFHQYTVRAPGRDALLARLKEEEIGATVYYPVPLHRQALYERKYAGVSLPRAEKACEEVLSLPMYPELRREDALRVCSVIRDFYGT